MDTAPGPRPHRALKGVAGPQRDRKPAPQALAKPPDAFYKEKDGADTKEKDAADAKRDKQTETSAPTAAATTTPNHNSDTAAAQVLSSTSASASAPAGFGQSAPAERTSPQNTGKVGKAEAKDAEEQKVGGDSDKDDEHTGWPCPVCTYLNPEGMHECEMCQSAPPQDNPKRAEQAHAPRQGQCKKEDQGELVRRLHKLKIGEAVGTLSEHGVCTTADLLRRGPDLFDLLKPVLKLGVRLKLKKLVQLLQSEAGGGGNGSGGDGGGGGGEDDPPITTTS